MIYQIVEIKTGCIHIASEKCDRHLKQNLALINTSGLRTSGVVKYAIACLLPTAMVIQGNGYLFPYKLNEWSETKQQNFWNWYLQEGNSDVVPVKALYGKKEAIAT